ncbi:hypothetical protein, partial [Agriterribacter sp.]|uniref:hypothetical protein n=1 Tax=Agriterribacter sp. TaxID=2821509 RepID=UPI002C9BB69D
SCYKLRNLLLSHYKTNLPFAGRIGGAAFLVLHDRNNCTMLFLHNYFEQQAKKSKECGKCENEFQGRKTMLPRT